MQLTAKQIKRVNNFLKSDKYKISVNKQKINNGIKPFDWPAYKNPIYNDSKEWIDYEIKKFTNSIKKIKPSLISITRSVKSGYTPYKYAKFIEIDESEVFLEIL